MKKLAIAFSLTTAMCATMGAYTEAIPSYMPVGNILISSTTTVEELITDKNELLANCPQKDDCKKDDCEKKECETAPVFNSCTEIQDWKIKFFEKRCKIYNQLGLSQEQRVQAKTIDERFFDEIAPLKMCCKQEKAKLKEMECKKCKWCERKEQKEKINDLKSEIKDKKKQHKECFEKILNDCQKNQYKKIAKDKNCGC